MLLTHAFFGFPKCATKMVSTILRLHPEIDSSKSDETHFFSDESVFGNGWAFNLNRNWLGLSGNTVRVEHDVRGVYDRWAAARLKSLSPDAGLILSVRDPVARAISNYWYVVRYFSEFRTPDEALRPESIKDPFRDRQAFLQFPKDYVGHGRYDIYVSELLRHFDESRIHVVDVSRLGTDLLGEVDRLCKFLRVDFRTFPSDKLRSDARPNAGGPVRISRCFKSENGVRVEGISLVDADGDIARNPGGIATIFGASHQTLRAFQRLQDEWESTDWERLTADLREFYAPTYRFMAERFGVVLD